MKYRIEKDTMGEVKVPADKFWGAQTERSLENFKIGPPASMPLPIIKAFASLQVEAAYGNCDVCGLPRDKRDAIATVCDDIFEAKLTDEFPLVTWESASGTESHMNGSEVIANKVHFNISGEITDDLFV